MSSTSCHQSRKAFADNSNSGRIIGNDRAPAISDRLVRAPDLDFIRAVARSFELATRLAVAYYGSCARRLAKIMVVANGWACLRLSLGIFQLLGAVKMDVYGSLFW